MRSSFPRPEQSAATPLLVEVFTIPTTAFSWLKASILGAFKSITILRRYAKLVLTLSK